MTDDDDPIDLARDLRTKARELRKTAKALDALAEKLNPRRGETDVLPDDEIPEIRF